MINNNRQIILTDVDGVLLNWEYAFKCWMEQYGYELKDVLKGRRLRRFESPLQTKQK